MIFPYSVIVACSADTGEEIVVLRPEVSIQVHGPVRSQTILALVDSGADNTVFPHSIARRLGIETTPGSGPAAVAFGGQKVSLSYADIELELADETDTVRWAARVYFADFPDEAEESSILGHQGFLDYFTATFRGDRCELSLEPNEDMPRIPVSRRKSR